MKATLKHLILSIASHRQLDGVSNFYASFEHRKVHKIRTKRINTRGKQNSLPHTTKQREISMLTIVHMVACQEEQEEGTLCMGFSSPLWQTHHHRFPFHRVPLPSIHPVDDRRHTTPSIHLQGRQDGNSQTRLQLRSLLFSNSWLAGMPAFLPVPAKPD